MQNAPREHSAIPSTFIKLLLVIKIFVLSIFVWPLNHYLKIKSPEYKRCLYLNTIATTLIGSLKHTQCGGTEGSVAVRVECNATKTYQKMCRVHAVMLNSSNLYQGRLHLLLNRFKLTAVSVCELPQNKHLVKGMKCNSDCET